MTGSGSLPDTKTCLKECDPSAVSGRTRTPVSNFVQLTMNGLRRLEKYKPTSICVLGAAPTEAANALYDSVGFNQKWEVHLWRKAI